MLKRGYMRKIIRESSRVKVEMEYDNLGNEISERTYIKDKKDNWILDFEIIRNLPNNKSHIYFFDNGILDYIKMTTYNYKTDKVISTTLSFDGITTEVL